MCPIAWTSRRIPRVVKSTLSAEAYSLSNSIDRLGWIRLFWEWMKEPLKTDWRNPKATLSQAPLATAVTDCKSVFDLCTKTAIPTCAEYRTTLECLLIREQLAENMLLRRLNSGAQLADCLTKPMDGGLLRECLREGKYALFDENQILKNRSDTKKRLSWYKSQANELSGV